MQQNQWTPPPQMGPQANIPNNMALAIIGTVVSLVFCCLPIGIVAIVYATQVNSKASAGDIAGAMAASKNARTWGMISIGLASAAVLLWIVLFALGVVGSIVSGSMQ
jgi:hypothetical protein